MPNPIPDLGAGQPTKELHFRLTGVMTSSGTRLVSCEDASLQVEKLKLSGYEIPAVVGKMRTKGEGKSGASRAVPLSSVDYLEFVYEESADPGEVGGGSSNGAG